MDVTKTVFVVDPCKFDVMEVTIPSKSPSSSVAKSLMGSPAVKWAKTFSEANDMALNMVRERIKALKSEITCLESQERYLSSEFRCKSV